MKNSTRAFTLTETTIVVGVVAVVIGAVWVAAGTVSTATQVSQSSEQVGEVSQNIRSYYMNSPGIPIPTPAPANCDLTATLNANKIFPASMVSCPQGTTNAASCTISTAGKSGTANSFRVIVPGCVGGTNASSFRIVLSNLTSNVCIGLLTSGMNMKDSSAGVNKVCGSSNGGCSGNRGLEFHRLQCGCV